MRALFAMCCLLSVTPVLAAQLIVRDALSGFVVEAQVEFSDPADPGRSQTGIARGGRFEMPAYDAELLLESAEHLPLRTRSSRLPMTVWVQPRTPPADLADARKRPLPEDTQRVIVRVVDGASLLPASGATVTLQGNSARTGNSGLAVIELAAPSTPAGNLPALMSLTVDAPGLGGYQRDDLFRHPGVLELRVDLGSAAPIEGHRQLGVIGGNGLESVEPRAPPSENTNGLLLDPPATIRVGFNDAGCTQNCCGTSCSNVCVFTLEEYVRLGITDEWIGSWNTHSLRAGTVAYRSYGAWHVENPRTAEYDICSSACCQVSDPTDSSAGGNTATARTAGILLERNAGVFRAEYSSENNAWDNPDDGLNCSNADLSCGNGSVGSPAANWPCLADTVAIDRGCFGHGRGMSQWGTQRWAITPHFQYWKRISNHYFNASNSPGGMRSSFLSSPVEILALQVHRRTLRPGEAFSLTLDAENRAGTSHDFLLIGASLFASGIGYLDDPANDIPAQLAPGPGSLSRTFVVPPGAADASYDVFASLYLDVDENADISSEDLALDLVSVAARIQIASDLIFYDGLQP